MVNLLPTRIDGNAVIAGLGSQTVQEQEAWLKMTGEINLSIN